MSARRWVARRVPVLLAAVLTVGAAVVGVASSATAGATATVHRGVGVAIAHGTDFVGQYRAVLDGRTAVVYCINPSRRQPGRLRLSAVRRVPGLSTTVTRELAEVLAAHGDTSRREQAEAVSQALNYLAGNRADVARRARYLAGSTQALAMSYVSEARRLRGGYTVRLHLPTAALPGQTGTGTVTVRGPAGAAAGTVTLTHSGNVELPHIVRTSASGVGRFTYRTTGGGQVRAAAVAHHLPPVTLQASSPAAGYQRMVTSSAPVTARASAAYQGQAAGFAHTYDCTSECAGRPAVTLRACAPGSAYPSRLTYSWPGGSVAVAFDAQAASTCRSVTVTIPDGARVAGSWRYHAPHGWTRQLAARGSFVVDCPAAPPVTAVVSFDCSTASVTVALGQQRDAAMVLAHNTTAHEMALVVTGSIIARFALAPGATDTPHSWSIRCGDHGTVTVRSAVQRRGGGWNLGRPVTVTLP